MDNLELAKTTFNKAWEYLNRDDRSEKDDREMLATAAASWYHWRQVGAPQNRSVSDWQMSRVFSVLGVGKLARSFGEASLEVAIESGLAAFYLAMAHEAIARASMIGGDDASRNEHLAIAKALLDEITDDEEIEILTADLATLE